MKKIYEAYIQDTLEKKQEERRREERKRRVNDKIRNIARRVGGGITYAIPGAAVGYGLGHLSNIIEKRSIIKKIRNLTEELEYTKREDVREKIINKIEKLKERLEKFPEHSRSELKQNAALGGLTGGLIGSGLNRDIGRRIFNR